MTLVESIGFLHPGAMGAELARACSAPVRLWVEAGRSISTRTRAVSADLSSVPSLADLVERAEVVVSICPPAAATEVADAVAEAGFTGIYVDANAIAPDRARAIGRRFDRFVDGGVIGPPPTEPGMARMYLSGAERDVTAVADLWAGSVLDARSVGTAAGTASALKMAYAAWTKGSSALLMNVVALAESEGLTDALMEEWALSQPDLIERAPRAAAGVGPKAWRFEGEMNEIAATFAGAELPDGFHRAAAEIYGRLAPLKGRSATFDDVIALLTTKDA